jgi:predicted transcriptional regulator
LSVSDPSRDIPLPRSWPMVNNQADLAKRYGISRARVTQYLNLLKLPEEIIDFLKANKDRDSVLRYFTERRLRDLTRLKGNERRVKRFRRMIEKADLFSID